MFVHGLAILINCFSGAGLLLQCADVCDCLPDLFAGQDASPGSHGCAGLASGNAPEEIIVPSSCG